MRQVAVSGCQDEFRVLVIGDSSTMLATQKEDIASIMYLTTRLQMVLQQQILTTVAAMNNSLQQPNGHLTASACSQQSR